MRKVIPIQPEVEPIAGRARVSRGWLVLAAALLLAPVAGAQSPPAGGADEPPTTPAVEDGADDVEPGEETAPEDLSATGDEWVDAQLRDIDRYARRYPDAFADELQRYQDVPRASVAALLEGGWAPADVYFACALGRVTGRSCRFVVGQRGQPAQASWRALAEELGAGAGSAAFSRLKRGIVESYSRWARPLELDAELSREFPDHE